jgi:RNA polymerase sigma-70 factor (ECF subfamily)
MPTATTTMGPPDNDFALLQRFAADGDAEAFAEIVKRYAGVVYATSFRVLHDRGRAEDVSQEVFFRLLRRPQSVSQSLGGWLHQCATRLAVDELRSETARRRREATRRVEAPDDEPATTWQEISPFVDEALATLPDESRELLVRHFLQGKPQSVIAIETRTSPATISRRMRDAVAALRAELRRRGVVVAPAMLSGLCRMNAPAEAVPAALMTELGKMAIAGAPEAAATAFAWGSVSAWCDAAAKTWGWPAELVRQAVAAAATSAVALVAGIIIARGFVSVHRAGAPAPATVTTEMHAAAARAPEAHAPPRKEREPAPEPAPDVRVSPAGECDPDRIVLYRYPETPGGPLAVTYGDGRTLLMPAPLARRLIETQAGKTLEQIEQESARPPD